MSSTSVVLLIGRGGTDSGTVYDRRLIRTRLNASSDALANVTTVGVTSYAQIQQAELLWVQSTGAFTLSSAPTLQDGYPGQKLTIFNLTGTTFTIQDQGTLAGSNFKLTTTTLNVVASSNVSFIFFNNDWLQISPVNIVV